MAVSRRKPIRAAIYTRISDSREGDAAGVTRQQEDCVCLAERLGWTVVGVFVDNNKSAMHGKRPEYDRLLAAVRAGAVDGILVYSSDRLYRRLSDLETLVDELSGLQVATVSSGEVDLSTADGRLHARLLGGVNQHESEKKSERITRAAVQRAQAGRHGGGPRRLGYAHTGTRPVTGLDGQIVQRPSGPLKIVQAEAKLIRKAYDQVLQGVSLRQIAIQWNQRDLKGPMGADISPLAVRSVLLRPMNCGLSTYKDEIVGPSETPALVDQETWNAVRSVLLDPKRRTTRGKPATVRAVARWEPVKRSGKMGVETLSTRHDAGTRRGVDPTSMRSSPPQCWNTSTRTPGGSTSHAVLTTRGYATLRNSAHD
jgi:site-specific DNA recombinase